MLMGYRPGGGVLGVLGAIVLAIIAGWSLAWIFTWLGTIAQSAQCVQGISMMIMFPLTFLSNAFVPVEHAARLAADFVKVNPVSHLVSATRDLANHGTVSAEVGWALLACAVGGRDLRAAVGAQLPAAPVDRAPSEARMPARGLSALRSTGQPGAARRASASTRRTPVGVLGSSSASRPGAAFSAAAAIRSHAIVGSIRL